ncbi:MAG: sialidase family protein [Porticoccaceae bacterium]
MFRSIRQCARIAQLCVVCTLFGICLWQAREARVAPFSVAAVPSGAPTAAADAPRIESYFASSTFHRHVHSASISPLSDGGLIAAWFAGSREGAHDVNIHAARFDAENRSWGDEFRLISREATERMLQRNIRKLGNPVIALAPDDRLWLFYVSVSLGGWAGSAINTMYSDDDGATWSQPRRLITSPFFNISTLVRNPPVFHSDGSIGLPIYHEFLGKFAEYLYLGPDGEIVDKFRISSGDHSLQPAIVPLSDDSAVALLRNAGMAHGKVLASFTRDRGQSWSEHVAVDPWNPNSAVAAVNEGDGDILVALNDLQDGRFRLSLYHADQDLQHWRPVAVMDESPTGEERVAEDVYMQTLSARYQDVAPEPRETPSHLEQLRSELRRRACHQGPQCEFKYEYPTLIRAPNGFFHLVYSWNNTLIKHVVFNRAWVEQGA